MSDLRHTSLPEHDAVLPVPESVRSAADRTREGQRDRPEEHRTGLQRLHRQVEQAVETIQRLRAENERLRQRVRELETRPALPDDQTILTLDGDPDAVQERIADFIDAIDAYLEATAPEGESVSEPRS